MSVALSRKPTNTSTGSLESWKYIYFNNITFAFAHCHSYSRERTEFNQAPGTHTRTRTHTRTHTRATVKVNPQNNIYTAYSTVNLHKPLIILSAPHYSLTRVSQEPQANCNHGLRNHILTHRNTRTQTKTHRLPFTTWHMTKFIADEVWSHIHTHIHTQRQKCVLKSHTWTREHTAK